MGKPFRQTLFQKMIQILLMGKSFRQILRQRMIQILLIILLALVGVTFYFMYNQYLDFYTIDFWQNAVSNFIATLLGLLFGIPIALWINDIQHRILEEVEHAKTKNEAHQRKSKILISLKKELEKNLEIYRLYQKHRVLTENTFTDIYYTSTLPSLEVWKSFSDGGELEWLDDAELLGSLASAYHSIQLVRDSGKLLAEISFITPPRSGKVIVEQLHQQFETYLGLTIVEIELVLVAIPVKIQLL